MSAPSCSTLPRTASSRSTGTTRSRRVRASAAETWWPRERLWGKGRGKPGGFPGLSLRRLRRSQRRKSRSELSRRRGFVGETWFPPRDRAEGEGGRVSHGLLLTFEITILVLAIFLGFEVISKVPTLLHTPLMSGTNAIHGIVIVGAML